MAISNAGKAIFAIAVTASIISVSALSYIYLGGGQTAFTGTDDDGIGLPDAGDDDDATVQDLAPDFSYPAVDGGTVSLSGLRGKVVVLDFMATWCGPCESQIENLRDIHDEYAAQGVVFISIDVDNSETPAELLAFRNRLGATWHFALDSDGVGMSPDYSASSIPTMVFIDREGRIAQRDVGVMGESELRNAIDPLV